MKATIRNITIGLFTIGCFLSWIHASVAQMNNAVPVNSTNPVETMAPASSPESTNPPLFGQELFMNGKPDAANWLGNGTFSAASYKLGPGDQLGIFLSGKIQQDFTVIINPEGKIHVPTVGVIQVSDLTLAEIHDYLKKRVAKFYDNFALDVMLMQPKRVLVAVVGEVRKPGKYQLSSLHSVIDAALMAGGPTEIGSYRNVYVYRDQKLFAHVDIYDFLMDTAIPTEIFLEPGDRVYFPVRQATVTVTGEVNRTKQFELKPGANERFTDIIKMAGGFTEYANLEKIEISRLLPSGERKVVYVNYLEILNGADDSANILMQNDDRIHVSSKLDYIHPRTIYVSGEAKRPGEYPLEDGLTLSDLLHKAGYFNRNAYMLEAEIAKIDPNRPTKFIKVSLDSLFNYNGPDPLLEEDDRLFIRRIPEWQVGPVVEVSGEMMFPGLYSITRDSTRLSEILTKAGGFTDDALIRESKLIRKSSKITIDKEYERLKQMSRDQMSKAEYQYLVMKENTRDVGQIVVDFYKLTKQHDQREDVILENGDQIIIPKAPKVVYVTGRVSNPGGVIFVPNKNLKYYLEKAGGAAWDADVHRTKVTKVSGEILDDEDVSSFTPGDIVWIPRKPEHNWWQIFLQTMAVAGQIATIYLLIDRTTNN
ncbi:SLBB domain-containing protein [candidate division KSB1 bacterium]|nr:SLBB domain-containing protein [candidate division KSB1 bacterium]